MESSGKVWVLYHLEHKAQSRPLSIAQAQVEILNFKNKELGSILIWTPGWNHWQNLRDFLKSDQKFFVLAHPPIKTASSSYSQSDLENDTAQITITDYLPNEASNPKTVTITQTKTTESTPFTEVSLEQTHPSGLSSSFHAPDFNGEELSLTQVLNTKPVRALQKKEPPPSDRRTNSRFDFKLEVMLISRTHTFRTCSQNISLGGTLLCEPIPKDFFNKSFDLLIVNKLDPNPTTGRLLFKARIVGELLNPRRLRFIEVDKTMTQKLQALLVAYITYQNTAKKKFA